MADDLDVTVRHVLNDGGVDWFDSIVIEPGSKGQQLVIIHARFHDVSFEDLQRVSGLLGTTKINMDSEVREGGYCETCRYSYSITVLTVSDIRIPRLGIAT